MSLVRGVKEADAHNRIGDVNVLMLSDTVMTSEFKMTMNNPPRFNVKI